VSFHDLEISINAFSNLSKPYISHALFLFSTIQSLYVNNISQSFNSNSFILISAGCLINLIQAANHHDIIFSAVAVCFLKIYTGTCHIQTNFILEILSLNISKNTHVIKFLD
jgi:hypothetical protein